VNLSAKQTGPADLTVFNDGEVVAEIRDLKLCLARFRRGGRPLIGSRVPMPLYWMQYANHQDPERNAGSHARASLVSVTSGSVVIECRGATGSGSCHSKCTLTIDGERESNRYTYSIDAALDVESANGWEVTANPTQGEVEFANLWPDGVFSADSSEPTLYNACCLVTATGVEKIPLHHLESSDKHNIPMKEGDRFLWVGEEENPCIRLLGGKSIQAGICAYMWDAHFAFEVCGEGKDVVIPGGMGFRVRFELSSWSRVEILNTLKYGLDRPSPELALIPLLEKGTNRFAKTLLDVQGDLRFVWPWETEGGHGTSFSVERNCGYDDLASARIDSSSPGRACWKATTLGPAYGDAPFPHGARYKLTAFAKCSNLAGNSTIALRLHREDNGNVFELSNYEAFTSTHAIHGDSDWTSFEVTTPPISPAPDRLHILLIQEGKGSTWFDNVLLEILS
jgi:hypothetical protein